MEAALMPAALKAELSGAKTVKVPVDKAFPIPAFATACFSKLKLVSLLTISVIVDNDGVVVVVVVVDVEVDSLFLHDINVVEKNWNATNKKVIDFVMSLIFNYC
jgi:hypothetical protein